VKTAGAASKNRSMIHLQTTGQQLLPLGNAAASLKEHSPSVF
jgi:hypothetical protein